MMLLFGLAACQDEEKVVTPAAMVEQHESVVNTQAVKKDEVTPAVVQKDVKKATQAAVEALAEAQATVVNNPCSMKEAMTKNPCAVKQAVTANPCSVKVVAVVNPCSVKKVVTANPCAVKPAVVVNPCSLKNVVNPCAAKAVAVKVTTNFTAKCKACHKVAKDAVGPSFKKIQAAYGSSAVLAKVLESGFAVNDRKVATSDAKYKKKTGMMTSQYKKLIKKKVEAGKFTYQALADEIFSK